MPIKNILILLTLFIWACTEPARENPSAEIQPVSPSHETPPPTKPAHITVHRDVPLGSYFSFMDSILIHLDTVLPYEISEYELVQNNPWLIDSLENTDYYRLKTNGIFGENPQSILALRKGEKLMIPDSNKADEIRRKLAITVLDVNIPEFKLRIIENGQTIYTFPVRVGRNEKKYLAMAAREVDLRTKTGNGEIVRINRQPAFINPADNKRYFTTTRDDGKITGLPVIPWLEPELDGYRFGQLIHPTTNPVTLGKAYSNGCIGLGEADMWRLYYHAPLGTRITVRYDLEMVNEQVDSRILKNIYPGFEQKQKRKEIITAAAAGLDSSGKTVPVCDCGIIK